MKYVIKWEPKGSCFVFMDDIEIKDIDQANDDIHGKACFHKHVYSIWSFVDCNMSRIKPIDLLYTIARDLAVARTVAFFKIGLVATNVNSRKLCQIFIDKSLELESPWKFRIFDSVNDARTWCQGNSNL